MNKDEWFYNIIIVGDFNIIFLIIDRINRKLEKERKFEIF